MAIELHVNELAVTPTHGSSLFDDAEKLGIRVPTSCRKQGRCKECIVEITQGMELLSERTPQEEHLHAPYRLSCQTRVTASSGMIRCHTLRRGDLRIERHAFRLPTDRSELSIDPAVRQEGDRILLDGEEIATSPGPVHGLAVDIGTTTVVVRLFDLGTGEMLADTSFENPQRFGGSDVMSRITYDTEHRGRLLQRTLCGYLSHAIEDLRVDPQTIYEMTAVGNSTMRDIFFGLDVHSIGQSPYRSVSELEHESGQRPGTSLAAPPHRLSLPLYPKGRIYGLPIISGHVGADTAACMLAIDIMHEDRLVALMDIGTNTEIILGSHDRILAASCPAGPAFEGGRITWGMPGLTGAIEHASLNSDGSFSTKIVGDTDPVGICGSGLLDVLSELLGSGTMNHLGRFINHRDEIRIASTPDADILLSEADVNELAQAKGANVAGLHVVFRRFGVSFDDVDVFYLAGGFGRNIDVSAAKRIGLIPDIDDSKIVQVGNGAIEGASIALLSRSKRKELETIIPFVEHCRLESDPGFFDDFVEGCQFGPVRKVHEPDRPHKDSL